MKIEKEVSSSFPFLSIIALIFITLKLCGVIAWSWWWVTLPLWGGLALILALLVVIGIVWLIGFCAAAILSRA